MFSNPDISELGLGFGVILQYVHEMRGILDVRKLACTRQMIIIQPRYPETQRSSAQHYRPGVAFVVRERAGAVVGSEQGGGSPCVQFSLLIQAPVVSSNGKIVQ